MEVPQQQQPKRGRKPKTVYKDFDQICGNSSDDDHIILKLNLPLNDSCTPTPYNNEVEYYSNVNDIIETSKTVVKKPCEYDNSSIVDLLQEFEEKNKNNEWPSSTSIHCYWCCHKFENIPFGLPIKYTNNKFHVICCFCSLECAKSYNCDSKESIDEISERNNLISLLARKIGIDHEIKCAPSKLGLTMFGGHMDIETFRNFCKTTKILNVNFPPMQTLKQQIEVLNECDMSESKYTTNKNLDNYKKDKLNLKRTKPINNFEHTLDHTMNLKFCKTT